MSRQWHWLAATLLLITTAACSRPGTEEPDCPTKITLPPGATPTTTLDPRCIVRATTTGTADGDAASRWTGTVRIAGFYASICNAVWDGNVSLAGKDELTGKATLILVETSCPGKVVAGELVLKGNVGSDSLAITWAHPNSRSGRSTSAPDRARSADRATVPRERSTRIWVGAPSSS